MKSVFRSVKVAALFVGSVVGAGFATGQEVRLFFGSDGVASLLVTSLFLAVCCFCFLQVGAGRLLNARVTLIADALVSLCSFAVYAAMIAAAEQLLFEATGQAGFSALFAVGCLLLLNKGKGALCVLNVVAVPLMAVIIVVVGVRSGARVEGGFSLLPALSYGGMNLLFSGALMAKEGERIALRERITASALAGVLVFVMLYFMRRAVRGVAADMPFLVAADGAGLSGAARLALVLAVVTTMASCAHLAGRGLASLMKDDLFAFALVALLGVAASAFGFAAIVKTTYPVVSYLGLAATLFALFAAAFCAFQKRGKIFQRKIRP